MCLSSSGSSATRAPPLPILVASTDVTVRNDGLRQVEWYCMSRPSELGCAPSTWITEALAGRRASGVNDARGLGATDGGRRHAPAGAWRRDGYRQLSDCPARASTFF